MYGYLYLLTSDYLKENRYKLGKSKRSQTQTVSRYAIAYGGDVIIKLYLHNNNHNLAEKIALTILDKFKCNKSEMIIGDYEIFTLICKAVCKHVNDGYIIKKNCYIEI